MTRMVVGYAGCAADQVPEGRYPAKMLKVTYGDVPVAGAEELNFETRDALEAAVKDMDKEHRGPWRLTYE